MYQTISVERRDDKIVIIKMIRDAQMNTLAVEFMDELSACLDELRWDPGCRVIIITGQGRVFCAGAELKDLKDRDAISAREYLWKVITLFDKLEQMPQPTIAAINGFALGGGCEMTLACDFRIMSNTARLGVPEILLGILPGAGGVQRLPRLIGKAKATEMVLLGNHLSAEEAESFGLLYKRAQPEQLFDEAITLGQELVKKGPVAIHFAKTCLQVATDGDIQTANRYALEAMALCVASGDLREGLEAFFQKRPPAFPGFGAHFPQKG